MTEYEKMSHSIFCGRNTGSFNKFRKPSLSALKCSRLTNSEALDSSLISVGFRLDSQHCDCIGQIRSIAIALIRVKIGLEYPKTE